MSADVDVDGDRGDGAGKQLTRLQHLNAHLSPVRGRRTTPGDIAQALRTIKYPGERT
jgi:hypothetical protein